MNSKFNKDLATRCINRLDTDIISRWMKKHITFLSCFEKQQNLTKMLFATKY